MSEFTLSTVTIGIPVYNEEKYLAKSIESAINQTYKNIRILISDNCSADNSYKIALEHSEKDSRIKVFRQQENIGTANFEFLLGKADSEFFCFLGGHDVLKENFIEKSIKIFNTNNRIIGVYPLVEYFKTEIVKTLNLNTSFGVSAKVEFIKLDVFVKEFECDKFNTLNLNTYDSFSNIMKFCRHGNSYYGVYNRQVMLDSFFKDRQEGFGDLGAALRTSKFGYIVPTLDVCSYLRLVRPPETPEQMDLRYKGYSFPDNWRLIHATYPFKLLNQNNLLTINEKLRLNIEVHEKIKKFYNLSWSKLLRFYIKNSEYKICIQIISSYTLYIYRKSKRVLKYTINR